MDAKKIVASILLPLFVFMVGVVGVEAATIKVNKVEKGTGTPIKGATLTLSKPKAGSALGDVIDSWTTDGTVKTITVEPGDYILVENTPASGYVSAVDKPIKITDADEEVVLTSESDYTKAEFSALDSKTGKAIAGVKFQLIDSKGKVYTEWTSTTSVHRINRIPLDTYTLKVVSVPNGYQLVGSQEVVIDELCYNVKLTKTNFPPTTEEETITNVPDTNANSSMILYGAGAMIILLGSGLVYKHAKQN